MTCTCPGRGFEFCGCPQPASRAANTYRAEFFARCPNNGARIHYTLTIETHEVIEVERINDAVDDYRRGFHEQIADALHRRLGGLQRLVAHHHGVDIETTRGALK